MKAQFFPMRHFQMSVWQAEDGTPMQCNMQEIVIVRRDGSRKVIPPLFACDGNSSPFMAKYGRRAAFPHDWAFWYCEGWWQANLNFYRDMRDLDGRGIPLSGAFWLVLTLWPWAYVRHLLRRSKIGRRRGWFKCDEARRILPEGIAAEQAALARRHAAIAERIRREGEMV